MLFNDPRKYLVVSYFSYRKSKTGEKVRMKQYTINLGYLHKKFDNKFEMRIYLTLNGLKVGKRTSHPYYSEANCNILEFEIV